MAQVLVQRSAPGPMKPRLPSLSEAGLDRFIFGRTANDDPSTATPHPVPPKFSFLPKLKNTNIGTASSPSGTTLPLGPQGTNLLYPQAQARGPAGPLSLDTGAPLPLRPSAPPLPSSRPPYTTPQSSITSRRSASSPAPTSTSHDQATEVRSPSMRAFRACAPCRAAHTACDHERPCRRCRVRQTPDNCVDLVTPYQQYLVKRRAPHACSTRTTAVRGFDTPYVPYVSSQALTQRAGPPSTSSSPRSRSVSPSGRSDYSPPSSKRLCLPRLDVAIGPYPSSDSSTTLPSPSSLSDDTAKGLRFYVPHYELERAREMFRFPTSA